MPNIKSIGRDELIDEAKERFFPRDLILAKSGDNHLVNCFQEALRKLNKFVYLPRFYELAKEGSGYLDTTKIVLDGIEFNQVIKIYSTRQLTSIYNVYSQAVAQTPFFFNVVRSQDNFVDFLFLNVLQNQLNKKFKNKDIAYMVAPDGKILLDNQTFNEGTNYVLEFLPTFKLEAPRYELYGNEHEFLLNYLEGVISFREGRAQSEMKVTGLDTNADAYITDGKEKMALALDSMRTGAMRLMGVRI